MTQDWTKEEIEIEERTRPSLKELREWGKRRREEVERGKGLFGQRERNSKERVPAS